MTRKFLSRYRLYLQLQYFHIVQKWTKNQCGKLKKIQDFCPRDMESCHLAPGKKFDRGRFWSHARQPLQQNKAINCNFRQSSSKHLITLEPVKLTVSRLLKIVIKNLVCERLAWVLAHGARKKRKLLARKKNLLVRYNWTGVFLSPESDSSICIQWVNVATSDNYWS